MDNISVVVSILRPVPQHPDEVVAFFSTTMDGSLGIIFGDEWPCIKRITDGASAGATTASAHFPRTQPRGVV
jgi:hypothetical protein